MDKFKRWLRKKIRRFVAYQVLLQRQTDALRKQDPATYQRVFGDTTDGL